MAYQSRSAWTSRSNRAVKIRYKQEHLTWHYPGFGSDSIKTASWSHDRCLRQIDTWERQHQRRGSKNIEYNWFACAHGYLIEGRGNRQNGANGTSYSNRRGQSCQVLIGDNEPLTAGHRSAMREAVAKVEGYHPGSTATQYGHRHWVGTRCPGPYVMAEIPVRALTGRVPGLGASAGGYLPSTTPTPAGPLFDDVDKTQEWLTELGYDPGPIDGIYGSRTEAATRQAQQDLDITPVDGRPGPATRRALGEAVSTLDDLAKKIDRAIAIVTENQRRINRAVDQTSGIRRGGEDVSLRQEIADAKSLALATAARDQAILDAVKESTQSGQPVDLAAVHKAAEDGAQEGVSQALRAVEADVTLTVTKGDG